MTVYTGYVWLEYENEIIAVSSYRNKLYRQKVINTWKKRYAKRFKECTIIISPDDDYELLEYEPDGRNARKDYFTEGRIMKKK